MRRGGIIRNRLEIITDERPDERRRSQGGWLAYSPPPLAVPLNYQDPSKFNRFETSPVSGLIAAAVVLDRMN